MAWTPKYENDTPIDDLMVVLDLLCKRRNDFSTREIHRSHPKHNRESYLEIGHHHDFSDSTIRYFRITERVVDQALSGGYAVGKPEWGYTDMRTLRISLIGEDTLWKARKMLSLEDRLTAEWWITRSRMEKERL